VTVNGAVRNGHLVARRHPDLCSLWAGLGCSRSGSVNRPALPSARGGVSGAGYLLGGAQSAVGTVRAPLSANGGRRACLLRGRLAVGHAKK